MKYTLLEMVQDILSDMDADEVNSIDDTVESTQVAQIIKTTYFTLLDSRNWDYHRRLVGLVASTDPLLPTHTYLPANMKELVFVNYDVHQSNQNRRIFRTMKYLYPDEFLRRSNDLNTEADYVETITDTSGVTLLIRNDIAPSVYTSFDDKTLVFDAYDKAVDDTLQTSKFQCMGFIIPPWLPEDDFVPDLPIEAFSLLLQESKSVASLSIGQKANQKAEQASQKQDRWLSRKQWQVHGGIRYPSYGRKGRK